MSIQSSFEQFEQHAADREEARANLEKLHAALTLALDLVRDLNDFGPLEVETHKHVREVYLSLISLHQVAGAACVVEARAASAEKWEVR